MKKRFKPIRIYLLGAMLLALPAVVQAQFNFTINNGAITITIMGYAGTNGNVVIPRTTNGYTVIGIGFAAFHNSISLTNVTIPNSITNIGDYAFVSCFKLKSITTQIVSPALEMVISLPAPA
jgi:hypothetical protein